MGEADELPVKEGVGAESADGDAETALVVDVQLDLGTVVLFQVLDEVPGGAGEAELLGGAAEGAELLDQLLLFRFLSEIDKGSRRVAVEDRDADALAGDREAFRRADDAVLDAAEDAQGLALTLLLLAADIGDDIALHLGPVAEGLAGAGNGLVGGDQSLIGLEFLPGGQGGCIALDGAVGLDGDEAAGGPKALFLEFDDLSVVRIDLRNDHGNVGSPAMGAVVGDDGGLGLSVFFLNGLDLFLGHIDGAEAEIHLGGDGFDVFDIFDHDIAD